MGNVPMIRRLRSSFPFAAGVFPGCEVLALVAARSQQHVPASGTRNGRCPGRWLWCVERVPLMVFCMLQRIWRVAGQGMEGGINVSFQFEAGWEKKQNDTCDLMSETYYIVT